MSRNSDIFSENYAIVFAGGGARGAWQIGVWKALREKFKNAVAVSGTSVGALNAALYAMSPDNPTPAENIWINSIQKNPIITPEIPLLNKVVTVSGIVICFFANLKRESKDQICRPNKNLRSVIREGIMGRKFQLPTYICAYDRKEKEPRFPRIDDAMDEERRCEWLLASTAIPYIFPNIKIDGVSYSDGGFGWDHVLRVNPQELDRLQNVPLEPIIEKHGDIKNIFVLTLSQNEVTFWEKAKLGFNIIPIMPNKELGDPLDFSKNHIKEVMDQGVDDGKKWLEKRGRLIINYANLNHFHEIGKQIDACAETFKNVKSCRKKELADSIREFKDALKKYKKNRTWDNEKKLNGCKLLRFYDYDDISNMQALIYSSVCGKDGLNFLKGLREKLEVNYDAVYQDIDQTKRKSALSESYEKHKLASEKRDGLSFRKGKKLEKELLKEREASQMIPEDGSKQTQEVVTDHERRLAQHALNQLERDIEELVKEFEKEVESAHDKLDQMLQDDKLPDCLTPKCYPDFVGRDDKLAELKKAIKDNPDKAIVLYGYPGNGKKQLALEYAGRHQEEFSGGCFVIDAKGTKNFAEALRSLLDDYNICKYWNLQPDKIGDSEDIRTKTVSDNLKKDKKKKLIILTHIDSPLLFDNDDAFGSFLDPDIITVIATAKESIPKPIKSIQIEVPSLSPDDSISLLKKFCLDGVGDDMLKKITKGCGGNPWALKFVGKKFHEISSQLEEGDEADFEQESGKIEKIVFNEFCSNFIKPVYESLQEGEKRIWMYAALLSYGKISRRWLDEISGEEYSRKAVSRLRRCSLIDDVSSPEDKKNKIHWYEMLENTREAIFQIVDQNELQCCAEKLCKHIAENEMKNHTFSQEETLTLAKCFCGWSDQPWKQKILPLLFSLSMHDDLGDYLSEYKMFDWRRKVCDAAEKIIGSMEDGESKSKYQASCLIYRGHINFDCGKPDDALACYQESHEIRQKIFHDGNVVFLPLEYQATVHAHKRNLDEAENIFRECKSKFESYLDKEMDAQRDVRTAYETLARLYKRWADALSENEKKREAEKKYNLAIDCAEKASNTEKNGSIASILLGRFQRDLGVFYKKENEVEKAIECLERSCETLGSLPESENNPDIKDNQKDLAELKSRKEKETL